MKRMSKNAMVALTAFATAVSLTGCSNPDKALLKAVIQKAVSESKMQEHINGRIETNSISHNNRKNDTHSSDGNTDDDVKLIEEIGSSSLYSAHQNMISCVYGPPETNADSGGNHTGETETNASQTEPATDQVESDTNQPETNTEKTNPATEETNPAVESEWGFDESENILVGVYGPPEPDETMEETAPTPDENPEKPDTGAGQENPDDFVDTPSSEEETASVSGK